jgi:hypothetical protein
MKPKKVPQVKKYRTIKTEDSGCGIESIADFVYNLEYLAGGGSPDKLEGGVTGLGEDGLEVTRIAVAVHKSLESGKIESV